MCGSDDEERAVSGQGHAEDAPNWVAEHLGASSRRPRHLALDVQMDGVRKRPVKWAKKPFLTATAIK